MVMFIQALMSILVLLGCATLNPVGANEQTGGQRAGQLHASYAWYDEKQQEHRVWLNPTMVAEINSSSVDDDVLRDASPDMREVPSRYRGIRLWAVNQETQMDKVVSRAQSSNSAPRYHQVMHDVPSGSAPVRLALGNIIVHFNPEWSESAVRQWAVTQKLQILHRLPSGPNNYVIQSGPGLEAINLANSLHELPGITAAFPDWAIPRAKR